MQTRLNKFMDGILSSHPKLDLAVEQGRPRDGHYQGRYAAYLREKIIEPRLNEIFFDEYDELPRTVYVSASVDGQVLGGVRIKLLEDLSDPSISTRVYGENLQDRLDMGATAIDVSRMFTLKSGGTVPSYLQFCLMRAIFKCAESYDVRYILAPVKAGHVAFYRSFFNFDLIAEPIAYPGLSRPIGLTYGDVPKLSTVAEALPFMADDFPGLAANDFPAEIAVPA